MISIIICTYNRDDKLRTALKSILNQEMPEQIAYEVVVVDNNSNDNTKEVAEEFRQSYPQIFHYVFEKRQGKPYALNTGINKAKGDILAFTDDDAVIDSHWILSIKEAFDELECNCFGGRVVPTWPAEIPKWVVREGEYKNTGGVLVDHDKGESIKSYVEKGMYAPCGVNMFFRGEIFKKYGGFNEKLINATRPLPMSEDTEFCFRLMKNREKILYFPKAIVYHPVYQNRLKKEYFRKWYFKSGRATALMDGVPGNSVRYFNVPRFIFRSLLRNMYQYFLSIISFNSTRTFFCELRTLYVLGVIYEYFNQRRKNK